MVGLPILDVGRGKTEGGIEGEDKTGKAINIAAVAKIEREENKDRLEDKIV